jgi:hypothetical protein
LLLFSFYKGAKTERPIEKKQAAEGGEESAEKCSGEKIACSLE